MPKNGPKSQAPQPTRLNRLLAGEVGSRGCFWRMRTTHFALWGAPLLVLLVAIRAWQDPGVADPSLLARLTHSVPWVMVAAVVGLSAHALWRIEVNINADKHPFTDKDAKVFRRALIIQTIVGLLLVIGGSIVYPAVMLIADVQNESVRYVDALYAPTITVTVMSALLGTTYSLHKRGRKAYENLTKAQAELEKGV